MVFTLCFLVFKGCISSLSDTDTVLFCFEIFYFRFRICRSGKTIGLSILILMVDGMWDMICEKQSFNILKVRDVPLEHMLLCILLDSPQADADYCLMKLQFSKAQWLNFIYLCLFCPKFSLPRQLQPIVV